MRAALTLALIAAFPSVSLADSWPAPWSQADKYRETVFMGVLAIDWRQSGEIVQHPERWKEEDPMLPEHPTQHQLNNMTLVGAVAHVTISHLLPSRWRKAWQSVTIVIETTNVARNAGLGLRLAF